MQDKDTKISNKKETPTFELLAKAEAARLKNDEVVSAPDVVLSIGGAPICTAGNFALLTGKAKSGKTFLTLLVLSAIFKYNATIKSALPDNKKVILFDTEQSRYHVKRLLDRLRDMCGTYPENLMVYPLRKFEPAMRLKIIEAVLYSTPDIGFVIIDGIRDVLTSINDEAEATTVSSFLLRCTEELNISLLTILHQNKNDINARGHIGSELTNKAETSLSVTKDDVRNGVSHVCFDYTRDKTPENFTFTISDSGLPEITETTKAIKKSFTPYDLERETHEKMILEIFHNQPSQGYAQLTASVKVAFERFYTSLGDNKAKFFIAYYVKNGFIKKEHNRTYHASV